MVRPNPNTTGRFFQYQQLNPNEREELREVQHPNYNQRVTRFAGRSIFPERGMSVNEMPNPRVREIAVEKGWLRYVQQPDEYDEALVREFYASLIPPSYNQYHTVIVRNREVRISPDDIRAHFRTPHHPDLEPTYGLPHIPGVGDADQYSPIIAATLRRSGRGNWVVREDEIKKSELHPEIGVWLRFIKANLVVSSHHTVADAYVARILYCLQINLPIDIGPIIKQYILDAAADRAMGVLPFPCLITHFCRTAGIEVTNPHPPPAPFDRGTYRAQLTAARNLDRQEELNIQRMHIPDGVDDNEANDDDYEPELEEPRARESRTRRVPRPTDFETLTAYIDQQHREIREDFRNLQLEVREGFREMRNLYTGNSDPNEAGPSQPRPARQVRGRNTGGASSSRRRSHDE